jgi:hypothetical protein
MTYDLQISPSVQRFPATKLCWSITLSWHFIKLRLRTLDLSLPIAQARPSISESLSMHAVAILNIHQPSRLLFSDDPLGSPEPPFSKPTTATGVSRNLNIRGPTSTFLISSTRQIRSPQEQDVPLSPVFITFAFSILSGKAVDGGVVALSLLSLILGRAIDFEEYFELEVRF